MKIIRKINLWLLAAAFAIAGLSTQAQAGLTENIDIKVSINATKSVSAGTTVYTFGALAVNTASNSVTALVITNDSGAFTETFEMLAGNALEDGAGTDDWTLNTATSTDNYVRDAQFSTARPGDALDATWAADNLTNSAQTGAATAFGNGTAGESGLNVSPAAASRDRNLWFRIITPDIITSAAGHTATVTISIQ